MNYSPILDLDGKPIQLSRDDSAQTKSYTSGSFRDTYIGALGAIKYDAQTRARDPFSNHAWVFAAASAIAMSASQSPLSVFRETADAGHQRRLLAKQRNEVFKRNYGRHRAIRGRYRLGQSIERNVQAVNKSLEPFPEHELQTLLNDPNELQDGPHLVQTTFLLLALNGEAFWVYTDENGEFTSYDNNPAKLYSIAASCMEPMYSGGLDRGELIGWWLTSPNYLEAGRQYLGKYFLDLTQVTQFKMPNPYNPVRGMSPITAAAMSIQGDLLARASNKNLLENGGVPRGVVSYEGHLESETRTELEQKWHSKFETSTSDGSRTAFLPNGMKYAAVGLSNQDIQYLEMLKWDREEILAVLNVPPSVLGITESTNFATQLGQDKNFYDKCILPRMSIIERSIDTTLMFNDPDDVTAMFDLTAVEALRAGQMDKISIAERLVSDGLHVPPNVAYEVVGLEIPDYPVNDVNLMNPGKSTPEIILEDAEAEPEPVPPALQPFAEGEEEVEEEVEEEEEGGEDEEVEDLQPEEEPQPLDEDTEEARVTSRTGVFFVPKGPNRDKLSNAFIRIESAFEGDLIRRYRQWIRAERANTLRKFNDVTKNIEIELPDIFSLEESRNKLRGKVRPLYPAITEGAYELTKQELGVAVFEIDDSKIIDAWSTREKVFTNNHTNTIAKSLGKELREGIQEGETIAQIRQRVASVFDISASSAKAETIARTEVSSLMNNVRDKMFDLQGVTVEEWVDASDEKVRADHRVFGSSGNKPRGFNYLTLVGDSGILEYPGDSRAPAHQVIRCRCVKIAVK